MKPLSKPTLRTMLRQRRRDLPPGQQQRAASSVAAQASGLLEWPAAQNIAIYCANDGEISTEGIVTAARIGRKHIYLPVVGMNGAMIFRRWSKGEPLLPNRFGILEPPPISPTVAATGIDLVFLPLVGWDKSGGRLGMGGGYYDRALAGTSTALLVGLAYEAQQVAHIPLDPWDVKLDAVITERAVHRFSTNNALPKGSS